MAVTVPFAETVATSSLELVHVYVPSPSGSDFSFVPSASPGYAVLPTSSMIGSMLANKGPGNSQFKLFSESVEL